MAKNTTQRGKKRIVINILDDIAEQTAIERGTTKP